jgi:hypothetical protein
MDYKDSVVINVSYAFNFVEPRLGRVSQTRRAAQLNRRGNIPRIPGIVVPQTTGATHTKHKTRHTSKQHNNPHSRHAEVSFLSSFASAF